jgi:hypothetical protein
VRRWSLLWSDGTIHARIAGHRERVAQNSMDGALARDHCAAESRLQIRARFLPSPSLPSLPTCCPVCSAWTLKAVSATLHSRHPTPGHVLTQTTETAVACLLPCYAPSSTAPSNNETICIIDRLLPIAISSQSARATRPSMCVRGRIG